MLYLPACLLQKYQPNKTFAKWHLKFLGHFKDLTLSFKEFQSLAPLKAKEHCPVYRRHKAMFKAPDDRVCLLCTWERSLNISARLSETSLCIIVALFRISFSLIGSHFSDRSPSEMWSYFLSPRIIRPAKFWTFCNLSILLLLRLVLLQTVEQYWSLLKTKFHFFSCQSCLY